MSANDVLHSYLDACPLIAILRGVKPDEVEAVAEAAYDGGLRIIEIPLNSPEPFRSIEVLAKSFGERALVGAGTVLDPADVARVRDAGGRLIVSPDTNASVIGATAAAGMISCPAFFTPSEAFLALRSGATALKLFPAEAATPAVLKAHLAVLPKDVTVLIVGGIKPDNMRRWMDAGATGFGLGSGLYKPGQPPSETLDKARAYVAGVRG